MAEEYRFTLLDLRYSINQTLDFFEFYDIEDTDRLGSFAPANINSMPWGERGLVQIKPGARASYLLNESPIPIIEAGLSDGRTMGFFFLRCATELLLGKDRYFGIQHTPSKNIIYEREIKGAFRPFEFKAALQEASDVLDRMGVEKLEKLLEHSARRALIKSR